jgi:hypothetical protein
MCKGVGGAQSTTDSPAREPVWSALWLQKPSILRVCVSEQDALGREAGAKSTTPTYTTGTDSSAREPSWSAFFVHKPSILRVCAREEDAGGKGGTRGGREAGATSHLKITVENGRADERMSRGQASEQAVCLCGGVCREGGTSSSSAGRRRVSARRPPSTVPRLNWAHV